MLVLLVFNICARGGGGFVGLFFQGSFRGRVAIYLLVFFLVHLFLLAGKLICKVLMFVISLIVVLAMIVNAIIFVFLSIEAVSYTHLTLPTKRIV